MLPLSGLPRSRHELQAEFDAAAMERDEAVRRYHRVQCEIWDAEREWDEAKKRGQRALVALVNEQQLRTNDTIADNIALNH